MQKETNYQKYVNSLKGRKAYFYHWINHLISFKFRINNSFEDWISGFEDRYTKEELELMKEWW